MQASIGFVRALASLAECLDQEAERLYGRRKRRTRKRPRQRVLSGSVARAYEILLFASVDSEGKVVASTEVGLAAREAMAPTAVAHKGPRLSHKPSSKPILDRSDAEARRRRVAAALLASSLEISSRGSAASDAVGTRTPRYL